MPRAAQFAAVLYVLLSAGLAPAFARGAEPSDQGNSPEPATPQVPLGLDAEQRPPAGITAPALTPGQALQAELRDLLDRRRAELDHLRAERTQAETAEARDELGARIREEKLRFHIQLLELSARAATQREDSDSEEKIVAGLEVLRRELEKTRERREGPAAQVEEGER